MRHETFALFALASLVLAVTPGPAVFYIVTRSLHQGRLPGLVSVLGVVSGGFCHVLLAAFGLSALLATSALAFSVVKLLGAAYLIWLGISKLRGPSGTLPAQAAESVSLWKVYRDGVVTNLLNPKTALFLLAFLPQFVDRTAGGATLQFVILGCTFLGIAFCTDTLYALAASSARAFVIGRWGQAERYVAGSVYVGLGLLAAFASRGEK